MRRKITRIASPLILLATAGAFAWYIAHHTSLVRSLAHTSPLAIGLIFVLYCLWFGALLLVLRFSMQVFGRRAGGRELFLLNAYSSLTNFFGPGQSGPAMRGAYLKRRYGVSVRQYIFTTLLYYAFFAVASAVFLLAGSRPWWQTALAAAVAGGVSYGVVRRFARRARLPQQQAGAGLTAGSMGRIFAATALQACLQVLIYAVELHTVNPHITFAQVVSYTGAANFAMYVSLTPGAIGIRESFLLFSQHLHHISTANIVSANFIDRAVYVLFLGVLFIFVAGLHAKKRLQL